MKNKYQRMNKQEQKQLYNEYKQEKGEFVKKMERVLFICKIGFIIFIIAILYDLFLTKNYNMAIVDGVILLFCVFMFIRTNNVKINCLNDFAISKDKKYKNEIVKKYKK